MDKLPRTRVPVFRWFSGANLHWLVLCDHASNRVPAELSDLGLSAAQRLQHIAWDIGAADVARRLGVQLRAPHICHGISRLVIDANRAWDSPSLVPESSDEVPIRGNLGLTARERERRWQRYHQPYHRRIERHLKQMEAISMLPFVVSVHSFTPQLGKGTPRPWPIAVLWRDDPVIAHPLIRELGRDGTLVGDNEPYDGRSALAYTMERHAIQRGLPHITIELRQDQLHTPAARAYWTKKLRLALLKVTGRHTLSS